MNIKRFLSKEISKKVICVVILLIIALLSIFVVSKPATSPENYKRTIESIDEKKAAVMGITATAATASTVLAAIPGDVTTPIANQILEISSYLLIVVCVLVLEKSLLTVMGYLAFNFLIPIACGLLSAYTFLRKETLKKMAIKFVAFAVAIVTIIPISMRISDLIYESNKETIEQVTTEINENITQEDNQEEKSWLDKMLDKAKKGISTAKEKAKQILNGFIDAIAIFIIAYCAIPIIVVLLVIWLINFLFKTKITVPKDDILHLLRKDKRKRKIDSASEV